MSYVINYEPAGACVHFSGKCTYKDILEATIKLWEGPQFDKMHYEIFDYLDVTEIVVSEYDVVELAVRDHVASKITRRNKIAAVAILPAIIDMSVTYRKTLEKSDIDFLVTDSLADACKWAAGA